MKATGIVRNIDELGRIVIPKELREAYNINSKDPVEVFTTEEGIFLKKYQPGCSLCGGFHGIKVYHGKNICINCQNMIKED